MEIIAFTGVLLILAGVRLVCVKMMKQINKNEKRDH